MCVGTKCMLSENAKIHGKMRKYIDNFSKLVQLIYQLKKSNRGINSIMLILIQSELLLLLEYGKDEMSEFQDYVLCH